MAGYQEITSLEDLADAVASSADGTALFFKHSDSCGISERAFQEFEQYLKSEESAQARNYLIVVQKARSASDHLARTIGVEHESPQAIVVRNGRAVWNDSHRRLNKSVLIEAIR
jgi:bacillithiol system protein YtxJ